MRKEIRLDFAEHDVAIGHRQRTAAPVTRRTGIRTRTVRPDPETVAVKLQNRTAARCNGMNRHHRRANAHPGHLTVVNPFIAAVIMTHIGRRAAHVKPDHFIKTGLHRRAHHANHATCRAGQDAILALKPVCLCQATARLHEQ